MKIFIDISVLTLATFVTGIQRVTREIIVRFISDRELDVILLHYHASDDFYYKIDNQAFLSYYIGHKGRKEKMITRQKVRLDEIKSGAIFFDLDAAWMCRVKRSYLLPILKKQGARIVAHIYDIISITHPQYCLQRGVYNFMDYIGAHLQYADSIIVNAHATVRELEKLADTVGTTLPKCHVAPLGADFHENKAVDESSVDRRLADAANSRPFLLMVGTIEPRKNHKLLLKAYDRGLKAMGYNIIFAGYMGWDMEEFAAAMKAHPDFGQGIYHFEGLGDEEISYLYQHAKFLAFLSYTEGFGLPIIEAIQRGTPVIASDIPVSREVAGDYCVYFKQDCVEELCDTVKRYSENKTEYARMKEKLSAYAYMEWEQSAVRMKNEVLNR